MERLAPGVQALVWWARHSCEREQTSGVCRKAVGWVNGFSAFMAIFGRLNSEFLN